MVFDLKGESNMTPNVGILYSTVRENFLRLKSITEGMSQEEVDYHGPSSMLNSTGQLIKHLAYTDLKWVFRFKDEPVPDALEKKYGPTLDENSRLPNVKEVPLQDLLSNYQDVFDMFRSECMRLNDNDLDRMVTYGNGEGATVRWGIWHISDHNRYHQAHINQLRKWFKIENY